MAEKLQTALVGAAGEHYVMAELSKRGVIAGMTPHNAQAFDILATYKSKVVRIRVKTSNKTKSWRWTNNDGVIFPELSTIDEQMETDYTVLVTLTVDHRDMDYYIIPTRVVNKRLNDVFNEWVKTPGKYGHIHNPANTMRTLWFNKVSNHKYLEQMEIYKNAWGILWQ